MQKKKITKLEIKKEDILNLTNDEAQKVIGGGADTQLECSTEWCSRPCTVETDPCSAYPEYTDLCGVSDNNNCESGWCQTGHTQDVSVECNRT
ncbi:class I lanthipeptide [Chryseobacterium sp. DT-3]|uniref:class I lanthipeptide n=1 Tax=Chryseobacterium sp. DT-3 TaxID=3396164 RepID=UPI003F1A13F2